MSSTGPFQDHWLNIDPERMERYETMYQWNPATEHFYTPAQIGEGQIVADFGCGPGHATIEFAKRIGPSGHVHALDINDEFVRKAKSRSERCGLGGRITTHLLTTPDLPLPDASLDRIVARNTLIYVDDPATTLREFKRVLRPGGIAHAIEYDWQLTAVEPISQNDWQALVKAASWAWPHPNIGRRLHGIARQVGFADIAIRVLTSPDTDGRLLGMIQTVAGYARESHAIEPDRISAILRQVDQAIRDRRYLAISPQFVVTATS